MEDFVELLPFLQPFTDNGERQRKARGEDWVDMTFLTPLLPEHCSSRGPLFLKQAPTKHGNKQLKWHLPSKTTSLPKDLSSETCPKGHSHYSHVAGLLTEQHPSRHRASPGHKQPAGAREAISPQHLTTHVPSALFSLLFAVLLSVLLYCCSCVAIPWFCSDVVIDTFPFPILGTLFSLLQGVPLCFSAFQVIWLCLPWLFGTWEKVPRCMDMEKKSSPAVAER